ncbi:hypothetical protein ACRALDRAFT_206263 [Sodiomyces alcalophilus JCM 7366]|uniref:uncharacterized protein n=1 Tax=Sodiomyces alcalophilus JCM 7366 TaxID=591952 RepID=UPI0039B3A7B6
MPSFDVPTWVRGYNVQASTLSPKLEAWPTEHTTYNVHTTFVQIEAFKASFRMGLDEGCHSLSNGRKVNNDMGDVNRGH